jgi:protein subunit release factor A
MIRVEVRGGEGGEDAALFAEQLTQAIFLHLSPRCEVEKTDATSLVVNGSAHYL